jgi:hypothetical protein
MIELFRGKDRRPFRSGLTAQCSVSTGGGSVSFG